MHEINLNSIDWTQARAFLAAVRCGTLTGAARDLGVTQPTLGRQVAGFEERLGLLLFDRVGRSIVLTEQGRSVATILEPMQSAFDQLALFVDAQRDAIDGSIKLTASDVMSAYILPGILRELQRSAPNLFVDVVASNDVQDLVRREADIAIRHSRPTQPDLIARKVAQTTAGIYAAPRYLSAHGVPKRLEDLTYHRFVGFGDLEITLDFLKAMDLGIDLEARNFSIASDNGVVAWEYARQGFGLAFMADDIGAVFPEMVRLDFELPQIEFPTWLVAHRELHSNAKIRFVFDTLALALGG